MIPCRECKGRGKVWQVWDPGKGIKVTYEDICEGCYGSGKALDQDEKTWMNGDFELKKGKVIWGTRC